MAVAEEQAQAVLWQGWWQGVDVGDNISQV